MENNEKLYLGTNGRYYKEHELATAYFLTTGDCVWINEIEDDIDGVECDNAKFNAWVNDLLGISIKKVVDMNKISYEELLRTNQKILAVQIYRDRNICSLKEAKEAIDKIQEEMEAKRCF